MKSLRIPTVILVLTHVLECVRGWCYGIGKNPTFTGPPRVEQMDDLSSVKVSWDGLVDYLECADNFLISYWIKGSPHNYVLTKFLPPTASSTVIPGIKLNVPYVYQVIARENKGILGIDYNRSPHVPFTITRRNIHRPTATPDKEEAKEVISRSDDVVSSTTPASGEDAASVSDDGIEEPTISEIAERIKVERAEWERETRDKNVYTIVGSVIGCLVFIILAAGLAYQVIKRRRLKRTLAAEDGEGNATYDRMDENCQCNS